MAILVNEPGHGKGTWPPSKGTYASGGVPGMAEHDFNAAVTDEINRLLSGKLKTYSAQPSNGADVSLTTRIQKYNTEYRKDQSMIGYSNHGNANANKKTRGFGVFYWHTSAKGKKLAEMVLAEYKKEFPDMPIWGTGIFASKIGDWTNFAILRDTAAPFVLIEWEFFTNDAARKIMLTADYRKRCGKVAAKVACQWYGIKFEEEKPASAIKPAAPKPVVKPTAPKPVVKPAAPKPKPEWEIEYDRHFKGAVAKKFTDGTRPNDPVTREEAAVIAHRVYETLKQESVR